MKEIGWNSKSFTTGKVIYNISYEEKMRREKGMQFEAVILKVIETGTASMTLVAVPCVRVCT